ncbi:MAG: EamA family transporter [Halieaceae bacterium]|nr:EamA family transporter [Halieaceae bacterium]MCP4842725.1 EamA family transporter [Halieaceae bacterium]
MAWGFAFYLIAVALESFQPLTIVNIRLAVGATTLYWVMRWQGHRFPREGHWWGRFALLTLLGNLIPFSLITWAETEISSSQAGLLMALMPISTMVLSHFFVHGDTLTPRRLFGVFLGFGGVVVLVGGEALEGMGGSALLAQLAVLLATLAYASNAVHAKRLPPIDTIVVSTGSLGVGALMLLPFTLYLEPPAAIMPSLDALSATLTLGIVSTGLATWMYFRVVTDCGPSFLSIINYIIPAIAFAAGVLFLNETAQPSQFAGLLLILAGIALTQNRPPARPA